MAAKSPAGEFVAEYNDKFVFMDVWSETAKEWFLAYVTPVDDGEHLLAEFHIPDIGDCRKRLTKCSEQLRVARDPKLSTCTGDEPTNSARASEESEFELEGLEEHDPQWPGSGSQTPDHKLSTVTQQCAGRSQVFTRCNPPAIDCHPPPEQQEQHDVYVNIYDIWDGNKVLAPSWSPLIFCGAFHAGVEVAGVEYSFEGYQSEELRGTSGIRKSAPRKWCKGSFRQALRMKCTPLSLSQIRQVIKNLQSKYTVDRYDLLTLNCCHFANEVCLLLHVGPLPLWVNRLAHLAAPVADVCGLSLLMRQELTLEEEKKKMTPAQVQSIKSKLERDSNWEYDALLGLSDTSDST